MGFFSKFENHSLIHLRDSLIAIGENPPPFTSLLEDHHAYLKDSIEVLVDPEAAPERKQSHLTRFLRILSMHARAEEETLYRRLIGDDEKEARIDGIANQEEHDVASMLADDLDELGFAVKWTEEMDAKAKVLANLVRNHIREEEAALLPLVRRILDEDELRFLAETYVDKCRTYLDEEMRASATISGSDLWVTLDPR